MKIFSNSFYFIIFSFVIFYSCIQNKPEKIIVSKNEISKQVLDSITLNRKQNGDSIEKLKRDSLQKKADREKQIQDKQAIDAAQKDFFSSLKRSDKDYGENSYSKMQKILKKHKVTPYMLYLELTNIYKKAKEEAIRKAVLSGLKERKYTDFIDKIEDLYVFEFQAKYEMDSRLYQYFKNNYCSCVGTNAEKYCLNGKCVLMNGEYWK